MRAMHWEGGKVEDADVNTCWTFMSELVTGGDVAHIAADVYRNNSRSHARASAVLAEQSAVNPRDFPPEPRCVRTGGVICTLQL